MQRIRPLSVAAAVLLLGAVAIESGVARTLPGDSSGSAMEVRRVRAHFDSVLTELAGREARLLTIAQRERRAALLDTLRGYRDRGVFPHNYDFPDRATPYFVDRKTGTLCAVGYLLVSTGRRDIVDRVARANNNVRAAQLATDTAFAEWLQANGLGLAEAARIQPAYGGPTVPEAERTRNTELGIAAAVALTGSALASVWNARGNADGHRRFGNVMGVTAGALAIGSGAALIGSSDGARGVGVASAVVGGLSVALATRSIRRQSASRADARELERRRPRVETSLAPIVPVVPGSGAGVALSLRF